MCLVFSTSVGLLIKEISGFSLFTCCIYVDGCCIIAANRRLFERAVPENTCGSCPCRDVVLFLHCSGSAMRQPKRKLKKGCVKNIHENNDPLFPQTVLNPWNFHISIMAPENFNYFCKTRCLFILFNLVVFERGVIIRRFYAVRHSYGSSYYLPTPLPARHTVAQ